MTNTITALREAGAIDWARIAAFLRLAGTVSTNYRAGTVSRTGLATLVVSTLPIAAGRGYVKAGTINKAYLTGCAVAAAPTASIRTAALVRVTQNADILSGIRFFP